MTSYKDLPPTPRNSKPRPVSTRAKLQKDVDLFNRQYPIGTKVRYWRGIREGAGLEGFTKSEAAILGGHSAVVWIAGCSGCIALTHVEPLDPPAEAVHAAPGDFSAAEED